MKYGEPYHGAVELQRLMLNDARKADLKPLVRAGLARAYCELEEMKRRLRMRPLPKSIDVSKPRQSGRRQTRVSAFIEQDEAQQPQPTAEKQTSKESLSTPEGIRTPTPGEGMSDGGA